MDLHSQYPFLIFLKDRTSEESTRAIKEILMGIATPREILSDNGKEFTGKEFREVLCMRRIKHIITAAYYTKAMESWSIFINTWGSTSE